MQNQFFKLNGHALWMSLNAEFHASYCRLTELNTIFKYITIGRLNYYVSVRVESYICPALSIIQYSWCIGLFCKVTKMCFFINTFNSYTLSAIKFNITIKTTQKLNYKNMLHSDLSSSVK